MMRKRRVITLSIEPGLSRSSMRCLFGAARKGVVHGGQLGLSSLPVARSPAMSVLVESKLALHCPRHSFSPKRTVSVEEHFPLIALIGRFKNCDEQRPSSRHFSHLLAPVFVLFFVERQFGCPSGANLHGCRGAPVSCGWLMNPHRGQAWLQTDVDRPGQFDRECPDGSPGGPPPQCDDRFLVTLVKWSLG